MARRPVTAVYQTSFTNRSEAAKEEGRIKRLSRVEKQRLIDAACVADAPVS